MAAVSLYGAGPPDDPQIKDYYSEKKKKSWLPAAAAAGLAGFGAYKFMRAPSFAADPTLRALQQHNAENGFHRVVDVNKLPEKYRQGSYGMDIMPFRNPDGSIEFKVLEMNPTTPGSAQSSGGGSGLLDPTIRPGAGWRHYRAMTGRHAEPVAAMAGVGAALGAGGLARMATPGPEDADKKKQVGGSWL